MSSFATFFSARDTPSPIDPETIHVPLTYEPDPADLALSSVPGQEMFDPRKRKFTADELKPQPMIKKARKVFIPEDLKVREREDLGFGWGSMGGKKTHYNRFYWYEIVWSLPFKTVFALWWLAEICFYRMTGTGHGAERTTLLQSAHGTLAGWRRTRLPFAPPSWRKRTRRCVWRWRTWGRSLAAAKTLWQNTRPDMGPCEEYTPPPCPVLHPPLAPIHTRRTDPPYLVIITILTILCCFLYFICV